MFKKILLSVLLFSVCEKSSAQIYNTGNSDGFAINCITWDAPIVVTLDLLSFDAECLNNKITVRWSAASVFADDYFTLERSTDGLFFQPAGSMQVTEINLNRQYFSLDDHDMSPAKLYYRIKKTGSGGVSRYSSVITVLCRAGDEITISFYPNPTTGILNIVSMQQEISLVIRNISGQAVFHHKANADKTTIDLKQLSAGLYYIQVTTPSAVTYHKIILSRN